MFSSYSVDQQVIEVDLKLLDATAGGLRVIPEIDAGDRHHLLKGDNHDVLLLLAEVLLGAVKFVRDEGRKPHVLLVVGAVLAVDELVDCSDVTIDLVDVVDLGRISRRKRKGSTELGSAASSKPAPEISSLALKSKTSIPFIPM